METYGRIVGSVVVLMALGAGTVSAQAPKSKPVTVTGRVVDNICMLSMGLKGEGHRECAIGCDKAGVRMALLDEKANILYTLMADKPFVDPNSLIREHLERVVTVTGDLYGRPAGRKCSRSNKCRSRLEGRAIRARPRTPAQRSSRSSPRSRRRRPRELRHSRGASRLLDQRPRRRVIAAR